MIHLNSIFIVKVDVVFEPALKYLELLVHLQYWQLLSGQDHYNMSTNMQYNAHYDFYCHRNAGLGLSLVFSICGSY
jgi:hypothetical protein